MSDISDIDVSIIIVSYNTREMTLECIGSVITETEEARYEIIVIDNNSNDGSADGIRSAFPEIELIACEENLGFGRANNLAIKRAHGRRILLLNPDTVVLDRAIDRLVSFANETPACGVWGGRTVFGDGSLNPYSCWRRMTLWNLTCFALGLSRLASKSAIFNSEAYGGWDRSTVGHVDIVTGCFLLINRSLWEELGGFDPAFFMYAEESDLCHRARKMGARPVITPTATILHYGGLSETSTEKKVVNIFRGKITLMNRHWSPFSRRAGRALFLLSALLRWSAYSASARLTSGASARRNIELWRKVWLRRREWINGY